MTLAAIFLYFIVTTSAPASGAQAAQTVGATPSQPAQQSPPQEVSPATKSQSAPASKSKKAASGARQSTAARHRSRTKKAAAKPCVASSAKADSPNSDPQNSSTGSTDKTAAQQPAAAADSKDCPPPKIIVRQGGTKDPAIQLAGGPKTEQGGQQRENINELLGQTDENLKKTTGMQLSASQQDTITQTRQFIEQSKTAMANGDFERARTLAWKAQLLSQDLVNPDK